MKTTKDGHLIVSVWVEADVHKEAAIYAIKNNMKLRDVYKLAIQKLKGKV